MLVCYYIIQCELSNMARDNNWKTRPEFADVMWAIRNYNKCGENKDVNEIPNQEKKVRYLLKLTRNSVKKCTKWVNSPLFYFALFGKAKTGRIAAQFLLR